MSSIPYHKYGAKVRELYIDETFERLLTTVAPTEVRVLFGLLKRRPPNKRKVLLNLRKDGTVPVNYMKLATSENQKGSISYMPATRVHDIVEQNWEHGGRQVAKPGKWLRTLFTDETLALYGITDAVVEAFTNVVKAYTSNELRVIVVPGNEIRDWYNTKRIQPGNHRYQGHTRTDGTCFQSCMHWTHSVKETYGPSTFDFYDALTPVGAVQMAVVLNRDGLLVGRALVWKAEAVRTEYSRVNDRAVRKAVEYKPEAYFMDRPYGNSEAKDVLEKFAQEQGWLTFGYGWRSATGENWDFRIPTGFKKSIGINHPYMDGPSYDDFYYTYAYKTAYLDRAEIANMCEEARKNCDLSKVPLVQTTFAYA